MTAGEKSGMGFNCPELGAALVQLKPSRLFIQYRQGSSQSKATSAKTQAKQKEQRFRFQNASKDLALLSFAFALAAKDFGFACLGLNSKGQNSSLQDMGESSARTMNPKLTV